MTKPLRILIASSIYAPARNRQNVFTTNLAGGLVARGHPVFVVVDSSHQKGLHAFRNGVEVVELPL
jgi:hypothetical protein